MVVSGTHKTFFELLIPMREFCGILALITPPLPSAVECDSVHGSGVDGLVHHNLPNLQRILGDPFH